MVTQKNDKPGVALVKHEASQPQPMALVRGLRIDTMQDLADFGAMLAKSGYFKDARDAVQACVKVQAGLELGLPPVQAMTGIHIVEGKPTLSAALIAALVKRSGRYNYRVTAHDDTKCVIVFFEGSEKIGESSFSFADAEKAGVTRNPTWTKYRRNMLWARAMSNGARWYCPDIFGGAVYTPEELGAEVNADGDPVGPVKPVFADTTPEAAAASKREIPRLDVLKKEAWAHLTRLKIGDGMSKDEMKAARLTAVKRVNKGVEPGDDVDAWQFIVDYLKEEPTPDEMPSDDPDVESDAQPHGHEEGRSEG